MSRTLIFSALACALPDDTGAPAEIVFLPEGSHKLTPKSHPKGISVNVPAGQGAAIAAAFNADLAKRGNVKAWCDFEHARKHPVSCYPTAFRYEPGAGIMAAVEWSKSGRDAVEGRDVRFFSPEFYIGKDGIPSGIPDRGPVGGLVSEPAFRDIPAIAAADADDIDSNQNRTLMPSLILAALGIDESHADAEKSALAKLDVIKAAADRLPAVEKELTELKGTVAAANKSRAESLVAAAIEDGRLAAKDEAKVTKFRERIAAGDDFAEEMLAGLTKQGADLETPIISATAADRQVTNGETRVTAAQVKARAELGADADFETVWARAAEIDPAAFC